jgi:cytidylate kinase
MINNIDVTYLKKIIELSKTDNLIELTKGVDLNQENIGNYTCQISTIPEVRASINKYLILMIETYPRILMEGRDIGTVIAKDADLKIFITADVNKRAERRYKQLHEEGKKCTLEDVLQLLKERDLRDSTRIADPLAIASDAFVIDTSHMNQDQVIANIKNYIELS